MADNTSWDIAPGDGDDLVEEPIESSEAGASANAQSPNQTHEVHDEDEARRRADAIGDSIARRNAGDQGALER